MTVKTKRVEGGLKVAGQAVGTNEKKIVFFVDTGIGPPQIWPWMLCQSKNPRLGNRSIHGLI